MTRSLTPTPAQLRLEAARARAQAAEIRAKADEEARRWEVVAAAKEKEAARQERRLTSSRDDNRLDPSGMEGETVTKGRRRPASEETKLLIGTRAAERATERTNHTSLFREWLNETGRTATEWAKGHTKHDGSPRWAPSAVRAWMMTPTKEASARAIPEEAAELIAVESKGAVPAVDASWPSGISRPRRRVA